MLYLYLNIEFLNCKIKNYIEKTYSNNILVAQCPTKT